MEKIVFPDLILPEQFRCEKFKQAIKHARVIKELNACVSYL